ncbi:MAG: hypothetical protein DRP01_08055 [Archaeoglobales archaeon]|nr:MAG: hypothetical protein DRP01_08055 [Archaeoglobales archaeon]
MIEETEKEFIKIKVKEEDFERLTKVIDSPIFECEEKGEEFILDGKKDKIYQRKMRQEHYIDFGEGEAILIIDDPLLKFLKKS